MRCAQLFILPFHNQFVIIFFKQLVGLRAPKLPESGSHNIYPATGIAFVFGLLMLSYTNVIAQSNGFEPLELHGPRSIQLMSQIDDHLTSDLRSGKDPWIEHVRVRQATFLKRMVRARAFINNDSLQTYVEQYFEGLVRKNALPDKSRLVLIMNSPESNAACYGSGVFIVTSGLLANMPDEGSLAFILAHEIAHDELLHVQQSLRALSRERESRNPASAFARILLTDVNEEYIDAFRTTMYASAAMSREHEMKADSLALSFIQRAGYVPASAGRALSTLASLRDASSNELFGAFQFNDFPFKPHWLDERLKVYHRKPANTYLWSFDSLRSHPQMERRIHELATYSTQLNTSEKGSMSGAQIASGRQAEMSTLMAFQSIEAAYQTSQYDIALFNLLRMLKAHSGDPYLVKRTTGILVDMVHAKNQGDLSTLSQFTSNLSESERLVNNFLFNMSKEEVAELAYHFINNRDNFDPSSPSHYYLLWETCDLTSRDQVKAKVAGAYNRRFDGDIQNFRMD